MERIVKSFVFENRTKVYFGPGCVKKFLHTELKNYGKNILLAYGGGSIKRNGLYSEVIEILENAHKNITEFSGIEPNPTYSQVLKGSELANASKSDLILAVGGGSVMDCSKAISLVALYGDKAWEDFWINKGTINFQTIPLGVIPTVPASGSEVNGGAVITEEKSKIKMDRDYPELNPCFTLSDPQNTFTLSEFQTAASTFDTLSHVMETYFSRPDDDNVSDYISEALMKNIIYHAPIVQKEPCNYDSRANLMWAASMAEIRIIKLGKVTDFQAHNIAHQVAAYTNKSHGAILAVIQPIYYRHIYKDGLEKFYRFSCEVWGNEANDDQKDMIALKGIENLEHFIKQLGLKSSLRELGITDKNCLQDIAASVSISTGSYRRLNQKEILEILMEAY